MRGIIRASDVKWKSTSQGCQDEAVDILKNFLNKEVDYNIVLTFKLGERLTELKRYEEAIDAYKMGVTKMDPHYKEHPKYEELQMRLYLNLQDVERKRGSFN